MEKQTIIIVDDNIENLKVAQEASRFVTKVGANVLLTDRAQVALDLIHDDGEENIIGVITDLYFPKSQHLGGYVSYVEAIKNQAEKTLIRMGTAINDERMALSYISRLQQQFKKLAFKVNELPYGGTIALTCIQKHIPFIVLSDSHRHSTQGGQELDTATMLTPLANMGFVPYECLTNSNRCKHAVWGANKMCVSEWENAFRSLGAQWGVDIVLGKSTWSAYCNPNEVRQPKLPMAFHDGLVEGTVVGRVSPLYDGNKALEDITRVKAMGIIHANKHHSTSKYCDEEQVAFLVQVLTMMGQFEDEINKIKAQSLLWLPAEGNVRLPPHSWLQIVYRTDIGLVVAVSWECISRSHRGDNQIRCSVLVWRHGNDTSNPKCLHSITYWDFGDDLRPPRIEDVSDGKVVIDQFYWEGSDYAHRKIVSDV